MSAAAACRTTATRTAAPAPDRPAVAGRGRAPAQRRPPGAHELSERRAALTRAPEGAGDGETATQNTTPAPAPPVFPPNPPPPPGPPPAPPAPAPAAPTCSVTGGPAYAQSGTIPITDNGRRKSASFNFSAAFGSASGSAPRACEVRQYIRWDSAYHTANGGPPHRGFPSSSSAGTWYEDRDTSDKRYGHRSGTYSDPIDKCGDEYRTGTTRDMANGDTYCGKDGPFVPARITGSWDFQLKVVDVLNGDAEKASSSIITVNWG